MLFLPLFNAMLAEQQIKQMLHVFFFLRQLFYTSIRVLKNISKNI